MRSSPRALIAYYRELPHADEASLRMKIQELGAKIHFQDQVNRKITFEWDPEHAVAPILALPGIEKIGERFRVRAGGERSESSYRFWVDSLLNMGAFKLREDMPFGLPYFLAHGELIVLFPEASSAEIQRDAGSFRIQAFIPFPPLRLDIYEARNLPRPASDGGALSKVTLIPKSQPELDRWFDSLNSFRNFVVTIVRRDGLPALSVEAPSAELELWRREIKSAALRGGKG